MVSIIIPARNEQFLQQTIDSIIEKANGNYEILVGLDGYWPKPSLKNHPNVIIYHTSEPIGMRRMINSLVRISKGDVLMKIDGHCIVSKRFDTRLNSICEDGMICVPRQFSLDPISWKPNKRKRFVDYWFLSAPTIHLPEEERGANNRGFIAKRWWTYNGPGKDDMIDDLMTFQGSFWCMTRKHFDDMEIASPDSVMNFSYEGTELALKTWLSGGRVIIAKKIWYAHLHKGKAFPRGFRKGRRTTIESAEYCMRMFLGKQWPKAVRDVKWLVDKFGPVPTWENFDWSYEW